MINEIKNMFIHVLRENNKHTDLQSNSFCPEGVTLPPNFLKLQPDYVCNSYAV